MAAVMSRSVRARHRRGTAGKSAGSACGGPAGSAAKHHGHCGTPDFTHPALKFKGGDCLAVSIPVIAVLCVAVILLCRYAGLRISHALICVVLGFYLASTGRA